MNQKLDYERLVESYSDMIFRIAMSYLRNRDDAEDIVQEVFIKYIDNKTIFKNLEHEKYWLIRVTVNLCCNEIKSSKHRNSFVSREPKSYIFDYNQENRLYDLINKLEEKNKVVFELYYLHGFSIKQISKVLKITEICIRGRLKRARRLVKNFIDEGELF